MLQVAEAEADIGFRDEAAAIVAETYALTLDQDVQATPELILQIFETWASLDPDAATGAAEELAGVLGKRDPSAFEFAIWTGLSTGLASADADSADFPAASGIFVCYCVRSGGGTASRAETRRCNQNGWKGRTGASAS